MDTKYKIFRVGSRNCLKVETDEFDVFGVYFDYDEAGRREEQVKGLLRNINKDKKTVIIGDFNSVSKEDKSSAEDFIKKLKDFAPGLHQKHSKALLEMLQGRVPKILKQNGFIDAGKDKGNTVPTKFLSNKIKEPVFRLDYAFVSGGVKVNNFKVVRDEFLDGASDHYPIVIEVS